MTFCENSRRETLKERLYCAKVPIVVAREPKVCVCVCVCVHLHVWVWVHVCVSI